MQQDPVSLGTIDGREIIVRGALDPRSGNAKTRNIKAAIVPKDDLLTGNFSVWRTGSVGIDCKDLIERLSTVPGQSLFALCGVSAEVLRAIKSDSGRGLCVVDECECDQDGTKHEAHAHIALCKQFVARGVDKEHPEFEQIRLELHAKLKTNPIWYRWDRPEAVTGE